MNKFKTLGFIALAVVGTLISKQTSAQFENEQLSFGAGIGYTAHSKEIGGSLAYNLRGNYKLDEKNSMVASLNSQLPISQKLELMASAYDMSTTPSSVPVSVDLTIHFYNASIEFNRYFINDIEESFGIYGLVGAGFSIASRSVTIGSYDQNNYTLNDSNPFLDEPIIGIMINLGLGANFALSDRIALFGEGKIGIPVRNDYNSQNTIIATLPFSYSVLAGVRFSPFD